jgi:hypothetical protein
MEEERRRRRLPLPGLPLRGPLRTFALGGLVGAAGALATARRLRRASTVHVGGLAAFEDAPCFLEAQASLEGERPAGELD